MEQDNIEKQLFELELLKAIYSNSNEFRVEDEEAVLNAQEFLLKPSDKSLLTRQLGFVIKFNADIEDNTDKNKDTEKKFYQLPLEIICRLPTNYPTQIYPEVFVRCLSSRNLSRNFSEELRNYVISSHANESSILNIIDWIKENIHRFLNSESSSPKQNDQSQDINCNSSLSPNKIINTNGKITLSRMFIYSHHIYSVNKRKLIVQSAKDLNLDGFSMPGKPGMICVEGEQLNVQEYWSRLKVVPWQRLQIKDTSVIEVEKDKLSEYKKFNNFEEKIFSANNDSNIDLGLLFAFLKEKNLGYIFNLYFGVDGKLPSN